MVKHRLKQDVNTTWDKSKWWVLSNVSDSISARAFWAMLLSVPIHAWVANASLPPSDELTLGYSVRDNLDAWKSNVLVEKPSVRKVKTIKIKPTEAIDPIHNYMQFISRDSRDIIKYDTELNRLYDNYKKSIQDTLRELSQHTFLDEKLVEAVIVYYYYHSSYPALNKEWQDWLTSTEKYLLSQSKNMPRLLPALILEWEEDVIE